MTDIYSKKKRSWLMSRVRSKNTSPEKTVFRFLRKKGITFRRHYRLIAGSPDIAIPPARKAIFVNGDFWHGRYHAKNRTRLTPFWRSKIDTNITRDKRNYRKLRSSGWKILKVWVGDLKKSEEKVLERIANFLTEVD